MPRFCIKVRDAPPMFYMGQPNLKGGIYFGKSLCMCFLQ